MTHDTSIQHRDLEQRRRNNESRPPLGVVQRSDRFLGLLLDRNTDTWYRCVGETPGHELNGMQLLLKELGKLRRAQGWAVLRLHDGAMFSADYPSDQPPPADPRTTHALYARDEHVQGGGA